MIILLFGCLIVKSDEKCNHLRARHSFIVTSVVTDDQILVFTTTSLKMEFVFYELNNMMSQRTGATVPNLLAIHTKYVM